MSLIHKFTLSWAKLFLCPTFGKKQFIIVTRRTLWAGLLSKRWLILQPCWGEAEKKKRKEREMLRSMAGSVDYSIKPQFDPNYRPQTLLHPLQHKQTQSPQTILCGHVKERERGRRQSFTILQGPTKATPLLHLLYIIWQIGSNTESRKAQREEEREIGG